MIHHLKNRKETPQTLSQSSQKLKNISNWSSILMKLKLPCKQSHLTGNTSYPIQVPDLLQTPPQARIFSQQREKLLSMGVAKVLPFSNQQKRQRIKFLSLLSSPNHTQDHLPAYILPLVFVCLLTCC